MGMRSRCCVIGGLGFIGRYASRCLADCGRDVIAIGRRPEHHVEMLNGVRYVSVDYNDRVPLRRLLSGVNEVVDLAYATAPQTSFADPIFDVVSNLPASVGLFQEAVHAGVEKIVIVSTGGAVYGVADRLPITEDHPTRPISPYGITKLAVENYAWMFHKLLELPVIVLRPSNAYGVGPRRFSGQGFISTAIRCIKAGRPVEVYGAGGVIRDYIHARDIASAVVAALDHGSFGIPYNVGTGVGRTHLDVLQQLRSHASKANLEVRIGFLAPRKFDVPANYLDSTRLSSVSGWRPTVDFELGVAELWNAI